MTRSRKHRRRRGIALLPSLLTTGNLFAGYYAIVATLQGDIRSAAIAIGVAFVLDGLDGRLARLTGTQSEFGKVYDSIADVIAFGAAPAVMALSWGVWNLGRLGWLASFFFLTCAGLRLARFSVQNGPTDRRFFVGLPSPAAACVVAAVAFYFPERLESTTSARVFLVGLLALAGLMVSRIRYRSFKEVDLGRRLPHTVVVLVAMGIGLVVLDPENVLLVLALGYALSGPVERVLVRPRLRDAVAEAQPSNEG